MPHSNVVLISIIGRDKVGVVSGVTGYLFDTGANLADTAYAVLGEGFEFTCVAEFDGCVIVDDVAEGLNRLPEIGGSTVTVTSFPYEILRGESGSITHVIEFTGGDRPGLVARISEVLGDFGANIVRMNSRRIETSAGMDYRTRFAINAPATRIDQLESALYNTAGSMRLKCTVDSV